MCVHGSATHNSQKARATPGPSNPPTCNNWAATHVITHGCSMPQPGQTENTLRGENRIPKGSRSMIPSLQNTQNKRERKVSRCLELDGVWVGGTGSGTQAFFVGGWAVLPSNGKTAGVMQTAVLCGHTVLTSAPPGARGSA